MLGASIPIGGGLVGAAVVRLAGSDTAPADLSVLGQYGVVGLMAILGVLFARTTYKRETDRADRLEAEVLRLNTLIQDKVIPALVSETHAVNEHTGLLRELLGNNRNR